MSSSTASASTSAATRTSRRASTRTGWSVVGYDQRGHGKSPGERGRLAAGDDLLADLAAVIDAVRAEASGPLVLLGHSLGGLVVARFVAGALESPPPAWRREVDALVLSSPALDIGMTTAKRALLATLEALTPNLGIGNGLDVNAISRDAAVVAAYRADPLVHDRIAPRLVRFLADAGPAVLALAPRWRRADAAALRRQRPLRGAGRQRRIRRGGAGVDGHARGCFRRSSTRSSTSPSRTRSWAS